MHFIEILGCQSQDRLSLVCFIIDFLAKGSLDHSFVCDGQTSGRFFYGHFAKLAFQDQLLKHLLVSSLLNV